MDNFLVPVYKRSLFTAVTICITLFCAACNNSIIREGTSSANSDKECRTDEAIGTKIKKSICMSEEEWAVVDARNAEIAKEQERQTDNAFRKMTTQSGLTQGSGLDNPNTP